MNSQKIKIRIGVLTAFILLAAFSRIIPHIPNFSPLGAMALFGAAHFTKKWQAFLIPIAATWVSDLFINNMIYAEYYPNFTWFYQGFYWQYASYLAIVLSAIFILKKINPARVLVGAFSSTAIFFLLSNFGCWIGSTFYPQNFGGLITCYAAGIPFLKGTMLGDVFYSTALFGSYSLVQNSFPVLRLPKVKP